MPLSYAHSSGDGSNRLFDVPCEYLSKAHVTVRVDGVLVSFSWIDTYRLQTTMAPPSGSVVEVRRVTPRVDRLVTFTDGSTLVQSDLNTSTLQSFFLAQEAFDQGAASMAVTEDGQFSALNRRITSLANPVNAQDAVTKLWAETAMSSQLVQATQKAVDAAASAAQSESSAVNSDNRAAAALASKNAAAGSASAAAQSEASSIANKNQTQLDRAATAADRAQTGLDRDAAAASAAAAKKSAEDAALFDPATYYTKVQIDGGFYTKATIDTKLAGYATSAALTTAADQKVSKAGDVMTGNLVINKPSGYAIFQMKAAAGQAACLDFLPNGVTGDYNWRVQAQPNNTEFDVFHNGSHRFRIRNDGHVWAAAYGWFSDRFAARGGRPYHDGGLWEFGSIDPQYADRSADAPSPYVLVGLRASRGSNIVYLRAIQLRNND